MVSISFSSTSERILLRNFSAKLRREYVKLTVGNENSDRSGNGVSLVNFAT